MCDEKRRRAQRRPPRVRPSSSSRARSSLRLPAAIKHHQASPSVIKRRQASSTCLCLPACLCRSLAQRGAVARQNNITRRTHRKYERTLRGSDAFALDAQTEKRSSHAPRDDMARKDPAS